MSAKHQTLAATAECSGSLEELDKRPSVLGAIFPPTLTLRVRMNTIYL